MNRKHFLQQTALGTGGIIAVPYLLFGQNNKPKGDPLPAEKVKEFVGAGQ